MTAREPKLTVQSETVRRMSLTDGTLGLPACCWLSVRVVQKESFVGGISDRAQEIKRRRSRRKKYLKFRHKLKKASASEKVIIVHKVRNMTPGCETVIDNLGLADVAR